MVSLVADKLVFGRDQVVTATQAGKNFGEMRRRARKAPLFVSDRNAGIDTVIVSFDDFEEMALEIERLREENLRSIAVSRIAAADADADHRPLFIEEALGAEEATRICSLDTDSVSDSKLFE